MSELEEHEEDDMRALLVISLGLSLSCSTTKQRASTPAPVSPAATPLLEMLRDAPPLDEDEWLEAWFAFDGFPVISEDGALVADARRLEDGARGAPNLVFETYSVTDPGARETIIIVDPDAADLEYPLEEPLSEEVLQETHTSYARAKQILESHRWQPLLPLAPAEWDDDEGDFPFFTPKGDLAIQFREPKVFVDRAGASEQLARAFPGWSAPEGEDLCEDEELDEDDEPDPGCLCTNPAKANRIWLDPTHEIVVIEVAYSGSDICWEPEPTLEPFALPKPGGWPAAPRDAGLMGISKTWEYIVDDGAERARVEQFLTRWAPRFPTAPEVAAARAALESN